MPRFNHHLLAALVPGLIVAGCASTRTSHDGDMVAVVVENRSRHTVEAHVARTGDAPVRLGRVLGDSRRVFLVHHSRLGAEAILIATPNSVARLGDVPAAEAITFSTVPFSVLGAHEVRWVIRDGERSVRVRRGGRMP